MKDNEVDQTRKRERERKENDWREGGGETKQRAVEQRKNVRWLAFRSITETLLFSSATNNPFLPTISPNCSAFFYFEQRRLALDTQRNKKIKKVKATLLLEVISPCPSPHIASLKEYISERKS